MGADPTPSSRLCHLWSRMTNELAMPIMRISDDALETIAREALRSRDGLETGGILLGSDTSEGIAIRYAGGPGINARRGSQVFLRDLEHAQQLADAAWRKDESQWVGEWHTHLSDQLAPSGYDLESYLRHVNDPDLRFDRFVAIIVGLHPSGGIKAAPWIISDSLLWPMTLKRIGDDTPGHL